MGIDKHNTMQLCDTAASVFEHQDVSTTLVHLDYLLHLIYVSVYRTENETQSTESLEVWYATEHDW